MKETQLPSQLRASPRSARSLRSAVLIACCVATRRTAAHLAVRCLLFAVCFLLVCLLITSPYSRLSLVVWDAKDYFVRLVVGVNQTDCLELVRVFMEQVTERWKADAPRAAGRTGSRSLYAELFGALPTTQTRCSVIAAHPNDEIVGCGCLIAKLSNVSIMHVSNGAPRRVEEAQVAGFESIDHYAETRKRECLAALSLAQITPEQVINLELGQFEASSNLVPLALNLVKFLQRTTPQVVFTHAYEGGHPDHDATAFATHAAVRLLNENGFKPPVIFEMAIYPGDRGLSKVPDFLQSPARESTTLVPDAEARDLKLKMFACFESQKQIFDKSPLGPEKFRQAPAYDFHSPPHPGRLYYEEFDWGISGDMWRALASQALEELFDKPNLRAN